MTVHHAASRVLRQGLRAALVIGALAAPALAADSLEIIAPAGPGGGYDQLARAVQQTMEQAGLASDVQVINVPGAGGTIGLAQFAADTRTGDKAIVLPLISGSEDFSEYQLKVPGFFFILGAPPKGRKPSESAPNHSPQFDFDEDAMPIGARTLAALALDRLSRGR